MARVGQKKQGGFTLIELILVIVILGIVSGMALPKFADITSDANEANSKGVEGAVNSGLAMYRSNALVSGTTVFLNQLDTVVDGGTCSASTPCFVNVMDQGIVDADWVKTNSSTYVYNGSVTFTFTPPTSSATGNFYCSAGC